MMHNTFWFSAGQIFLIFLEAMNKNASNLIATYLFSGAPRRLCSCLTNQTGKMNLVDTKLHANIEGLCRRIQSSVYV